VRPRSALSSSTAVQRTGYVGTRAANRNKLAALPIELCAARFGDSPRYVGFSLVTPTIAKFAIPLLVGFRCCRILTYAASHAAAPLLFVCDRVKGTGAATPCA
jgi:hypothetical protein